MPKNIASVQFLRFIAASLVVCHHTTNAVGQHFGIIPNRVIHVTDLGAAGVDIFFVISGFVMVYTSFYFKDSKFDCSRFVTRRLIRIFPIYFVYAALYLLFYYAFAGGKNLTLGQTLSSLLLWPGYSALIIGPGWTLSFELYFYFCFCWAMMLGLTRGLATLSFLFIFAILSRGFLNTTQPAVHVFTNSLLIEFLAGAWIGFAVVSSRKVSNRIANAMLTLALVGFLSGVVFGYNHFPSLITWGIPSALLVAGMVFKERTGAVITAIQKCSFLGDSSYSLYLLHIMLIDAAILFATYVDPNVSRDLTALGPVATAVLSLAIAAYCIAVAYAAYESIEQPLIRNLQNIFRQKEPTQAEGSVNFRRP